MSSTGCVASLIYYLELYENQQDNMKKDVYYDKESKIEIKLEDIHILYKQ